MSVISLFFFTEPPLVFGQVNPACEADDILENQILCFDQNDYVIEESGTIIFANPDPSWIDSRTNTITVVVDGTPEGADTANFTVELGKYGNLDVYYTSFVTFTSDVSSGSEPFSLHTVIGDNVKVSFQPHTGSALTAEATIHDTNLGEVTELPARADIDPADCLQHGGDQDEDGICSDWENPQGDGLRINYPPGTEYHYPCQPLYASGGNPVCPSPDHKDIFIEIDYLTGHRPHPLALKQVVDAFNIAPKLALGNPDGKAGINLHIQLDERIPDHYELVPFPGDEINNPGFDRLKRSWFGSLGERTDPSQDWDDNVWKQKKQVFHYGLFAHQQGGDPDSSGAAEVVGNDLIVSLGSFDGNLGNIDQQAGTLMHEIGHNIGLNHGGAPTETWHCKPNHISVMSYAKQFPDLDEERKLDYSRKGLWKLKESRLLENNGVQFYPKDPDANVVFGPVPPLILPKTGVPIDWNQNGTMESDLVKVNINYIYTEDPPGTIDEIICPYSWSNQKLMGHNDWRNLIIDPKTDAFFFASGRGTGGGGTQCKSINEINFKNQTGTLDSLQDPGIGHETHQLGIVLPPSEKKYFGFLNYSLSFTPFEIVTLDGPLGPGEDVGQNIWTPDGETKFKLSLAQRYNHTGMWSFSGNALALHTFDPSQFSANYTVYYVELDSLSYGSVGNRLCATSEDEINMEKVRHMRALRVDSLEQFIKNIDASEFDPAYSVGKTLAYYSGKLDDVRNSVYSDEIFDARVGLAKIAKTYDDRFTNQKTIDTLEEGTQRIEKAYSLAVNDPLPISILPVPVQCKDLGIPDWIKNNAKWWATNQLSDSEFVNGIQFLISNGVMKIPSTSLNAGQQNDVIPKWIQNNAGWWAEGKISQCDFVFSIQYLISNDIIKIANPFDIIGTQNGLLE